MLRRRRGRRIGGGIRREARAPDTRLPASLRATLGLPTGGGSGGGGVGERDGGRKRSKKRGRSPAREEPRAAVKKVKEDDDPDKKEIRRLEKLLGIGKKRKRAAAKGEKFSYAAAFTEEEKYLADLVDLCSGTGKRGVESSDEEDVGPFDERLMVPADPADEFEEEDEDEVEEEGGISMEADPDDGFEIEAETEDDEGEDEAEDDVNGDFEEEESGSEKVGEENEAKREAPPGKMRDVESAPSPLPASGEAGEKPSAALPGSYVPPSRRGGSGGDTQRLGRRIRGLLNRLAEANAGGIAGSLEGLFRSPGPGVSRSAVIGLYADAALDAVRDGSATAGLSPFVAPHAAIITHLAAVIDMRVLAELLAGTVRRVMQALPRLAEQTAEEELLIGERPQRPVFGYVALLGALYMRRAASARIVHELVRALADGTEAQRVELLLALFRQIGPQLRADDPLSLKDMIAFLRERFQKESEQSENATKISVMLDLIGAVKNNKLRKGDVLEHTARFPWAAKVEAPLSATFADLQDDSFTEGRWWESDTLAASGATEATTTPTEGHNFAELTVDNDAGVDLGALAASLRLNTDFRRSLFGAIMSSASVTDAYERVERLGGLSAAKGRDRDTARVILHCCAAERGYNPFYSLLAARMCSAARAMRFTFEHALCDMFRVVAAGGGGGAKKVSPRRVRNYAQFVADLLHKKALRLALFKNVTDFNECPPLEKELYSRALHALLRAVGQDAKGDQERLKEGVDEIFKNLPRAERDLCMPLARFLGSAVRDQAAAQTLKALDLAVKVLQKSGARDQLKQGY